MVGVPRSKGCSTCLRRAVKCDEVSPVCGQCRRGGRTCPGYNRTMTFVDEGPKLLLRRRKPKSTTVLAPGERRKPILSSKSLDTARPMLQNGPNPAQLEQIQLLSVCISTMFPQVPTRASYLGTWLWHLPPRFGQSKALDYASLSLALIFFSSSSGKDNITLAVRRRAQQAYGVALRSLRNALVDAKARTSADTLAATLLLTYYESFANVDHAWVRHAGGAKHLVQARGAKRCYNSPFEYFMFLACRGSLIYEALLSGVPSFLDSPEWQSVPADVVQYPFMPSPVELSHKFFILAASLPGVLHRGRNALSECEATKASRTEASALRSRFMLWYEEYTAYDDGRRQPVLIPAPKTFPNGSFDSVFLYYDTASATMIITYYAYLILLNKQLAESAGYVEDDAADEKYNSSAAHEDNLELARWICMSVYYCACLAGHCGTSALSMVLPIARVVLPSAYHEWMAQW